MDALISSNVFSETYNGNSSFYGYTTNVFPISNLDVSLVNYYDDYLFRDKLEAAYQYSNVHIVDLPSEEFKYTRGLLTGTITRILNSDSWLRSVFYYDDRYRLIQTVGNNPFGDIDRQSQVYDFAGRTVKKRLTHSKDGQSVSVLEEFTYDHNSRLLAHYHQINNGPKVLLSQMQYNEIGQMVEKNLNSIATGFTQSVDYRYNIRGWLTHINNSRLENDGGVTNDDANDWFGFELKYNDPTANGGAAQFNGNISETVGKSFGSNKQGYGYTYDQLNRLKTAAYYNIDNPLRNGRFNEQVTSYDANGNIKQLNRKGRTDETPLGVLYNSMDALSYTYEGNQLMSVADGATATTEKEGGFRDRNALGNDYQYDANGNMILDKNKEIAVIEYNYLNLPQKITKENGDYIKYVYDAAGSKLAQSVFQGNTQMKKTDYVGGFIYENEQLQFFNHDEGRVIMTGNVPEYQYHLKDHLGNVRTTFTTIDDQEAFTATMESVNVDHEQNLFQDYHKIRRVNAAIFDHTNGTAPGYSIRLSGTDQERVSITKSLSVMPGDRIQMEVFAKYVDPVGEDPQNAAWINLLALLTNVANGSSGTVVDGAGYSGNSYSTFPYHDFFDDGGEAGEPPRAYLNYIVFDKDYNPIMDPSQTNVVRVSEAARENGMDGDHERLFKEITIKQPGYILVYLSNDNPQSMDVYFDDFKVTHTKSPIVQQEEYYPFGLTFNNCQREVSVKNSYLYNSKEEQDELNFRWIDYGARMYLPEIGRWGVEDPKSEKYDSFSPFNYVLNNPLRFIDPNGMEVTETDQGYNYTESDAVALYFFLTSKKKNVYVAISDIKELRDATNEKSAKGEYGNWSVFAASSLAEVNLVSRFMQVDKRSVENMVFESHGGVSKNTKRSRLFTDSDKSYESSIGSSELCDYNEKPADNVTNLRNLMDKVQDGGNMIFTACYLGLGVDAEDFLQGLYNVSGARLNVMINAEYGRISKGYKGNPYSTGIKLTGSLTYEDVKIPHWKGITSSGKIYDFRNVGISASSGSPIYFTP